MKSFNCALVLVAGSIGMAGVQAAPTLDLDHTVSQASAKFKFLGVDATSGEQTVEEGLYIKRKFMVPGSEQSVCESVGFSL